MTEFLGTLDSSPIVGIRLHDMTAEDFDGAPSVVTLDVKDVHAKRWLFWMVQADAVQNLVEESEHKDYLQMPGEVFGIVDRCTPVRLVQTVDRYLRDVAPVSAEVPE